MRRLVVYVHGKGGNAAEAAHYRPLFPDCAVTGFEYRSGTPWAAAEEFPAAFAAYRAAYDDVTLIANSIGAYFCLQADIGCCVTRAYFISPVTDMEALIMRMMGWAGVTEEQLQARGEIMTAFGETLSWDWLRYVRSHPVRWTVPTAILYGSADHLVDRQEAEGFAARRGAVLTVMEGGEHWFHTEEQMAFLDRWITGG